MLSNQFPPQLNQQTKPLLVKVVQYNSYTYVHYFGLCTVSACTLYLLGKWEVTCRYKFLSFSSSSGVLCLRATVTVHQR